MTAQPTPSPTETVAEQIITEADRLAVTGSQGARREFIRRNLIAYEQGMRDNQAEIQQARAAVDRLLRWITTGRA